MNSLYPHWLGGTGIYPDWLGVTAPLPDRKKGGKGQRTRRSNDDEEVMFLATAFLQIHHRRRYAEFNLNNTTAQ